MLAGYEVKKPTIIPICIMNQKIASVGRRCGCGNNRVRERHPAKKPDLKSNNGDCVGTYCLKQALAERQSRMGTIVEY